jgi:beta-mannanase
VDGIEFPLEAVNTIHDYGWLPYIRMMARSSYEQGPDSIFSLQRIIDGDFDDELRQWAQEAKAVRFPLMVEFGVEANGDWFAWSGIFNGGDILDGYGDPAKADGPERFRDAYRHIIDLFRTQGVGNVTWVFHVNSANFPDESWNSMAAYYPGDEYIDWIGISVYGPLTPKEARSYWETFTEIMDAYYPELCAISADKPLAVLEFGVVE